MSVKDYEKKVRALSKAITDIGWSVLITVNDESKTVPGLIIGEKYFLKKISEILEKDKTIKKQSEKTLLEDLSIKKKNDDDDPTFH